MKISRMAEENVVPTWALKNEKADEIEKSRKILAEGLQHFNLQACNKDGKVDEQVLTTECDRIDVCVSSDETYYYPNNWHKDDISHLKEYAKVAGLDSSHVVGLDPDSVLEALSELQNVYTAHNEAPTLTKTASTNDETEITPNDFRFDPFRLGELLDAKKAQPDVWETVSKQNSLRSKPMMESSVRPIRGGEDTSVSNNPSLAANQNSIDNPNAIQQMAESEIVDNGARLAAEQAAKVAAKKAEHSQWEQDKIDAMEYSGIVSKGKVFPTEAMNAQTGIRDTVMAAHSDYDPNNLPEKTAGEQIKEQNEIRRQSIQREEVEDTELDKLKSQSSFGVSDAFAESLKQQLGK